MHLIMRFSDSRPWNASLPVFYRLLDTRKIEYLNRIKHILTSSRRRLRSTISLRYLFKRAPSSETSVTWGSFFMRFAALANYNHSDIPNSTHLAIWIQISTEGSSLVPVMCWRSRRRWLGWWCRWWPSWHCHPKSSEGFGWVCCLCNSRSPFRMQQKGHG